LFFYNYSPNNQEPQIDKYHIKLLNEILAGTLEYP